MRWTNIVMRYTSEYIAYYFVLLLIHKILRTHIMQFIFSGIFFPCLQFYLVTEYINRQHAIICSTSIITYSWNLFAKRIRCIFYLRWCCIVENSCSVFLCSWFHFVQFFVVVVACGDVLYCIGLMLWYFFRFCYHIIWVCVSNSFCFHKFCFILWNKKPKQFSLSFF